METKEKQDSAESTLKQLHAYAKLLFLRSGRQFEDKTLYRELEGEISQNEPGNDDDSYKNIPLGNLDEDSLRRKFLDRLSETVSSDQGGRHVVASHLFSWSDKVKVFIAINRGFTEGDEMHNFIGNLCTVLKEIAAAPDNQSEKHTDALWNILLRHQSQRLKVVIVKLRQIIKSLQHLLPQHFSVESVCDGVLPDMDDSVILDFEKSLQLLAKMLYGDSDSGLERYNALVSLSHGIYQTFPAEDFQNFGREGKKLRQEIGFLGRLKTSLRVLIAAARQLPGLDDLSLVPVRLKTSKRPSSKEWSLTKTFQTLDLQLRNTSIHKLMEASNLKAKWTKNKLLNDFSKLKSPTFEIHAEIQAVIFILSCPDEVAKGKRFDYIGCSRYSCLLCSKFLHFFQTINTRGCHGKLYNHSWTLPLVDRLGENEWQILLGAVKDVISWMRMELNGNKMVSAQRRLEVKESTVGGSSITIPGTGQDNKQLSHAASEHLYRQRAENSNVQSHKTSLLDPLGDEELSTIETPHEAMTQDSAKSCVGYCTIKTTRRCSYCRASPFCSKTCEQRMPLEHLIKCNMRQAMSADYLYEDVLNDELPTDPKARQEYWFDRCHNKNEESHLLGVFIGLLHYHPDHITREELHKWRSNSNLDLVAKIVEKFEELPSNGRGGYFPWFLRHRARFELPDYKPPCLLTQVQNMEARARQYLAPEDQHKDVNDFVPAAKGYCFVFYALTLGHGYLPPMNLEHCHWFDFGFVVSQDQHEEGMIGFMYNTMLFGSAYHEDYARSLGSSEKEKWVKKKDPVCSFEEFWKAWENGNLMAIIDRHRPESATEIINRPAKSDLFSRLRVFLEAKTPRPSVWKLCHFLALEEHVSVESAVSEIAQAARDYGFSEKLDTKTTMELNRFYMQLLKKVEPLAVHRERMRGNLMEFAEDYVDTLTPMVKKVLQSLARLTG
ncbi:hypothetical protein BGZ63DRAFT_389571 [Mariannaea sp. PMI_226]|nr:hypothetical protein BGZ63DRAFT_389571 [Mariannaea sp. PMI_226]